jgi:hypothetical protein
MAHKASVSETWFHHKAAQCALLAKDAANPVQRSILEEQSRLWLQIAATEKRQAESGRRHVAAPSSDQNGTDLAWVGDVRIAGNVRHRWQCLQNALRSTGVLM